MPGSIAGYLDLETRALKARMEVEAILDEQAAQNKPLIDEAVELEYPLLFLYTHLVARTVYDQPTHQPQESFAAAHRAFNFGIFVGAQLLSPEEFSFNFEMFDTDTENGLSHYLAEGAGRYLLHRPVLDSLIGRYMPEICATPCYEAGAEAIAALGFMQIEHSQYQRFINQQAAIGVADLRRNLDQ